MIPVSCSNVLLDRIMAASYPIAHFSRHTAIYHQDPGYYWRHNMHCRYENFHPSVDSYSDSSRELVWALYVPTSNYLWYRHTMRVAHVRARWLAGVIPLVKQIFIHQDAMQNSPPINTHRIIWWIGLFDYPAGFVVIPNRNPTHAILVLHVCIDCNIDMTVSVSKSRERHCRNSLRWRHSRRHSWRVFF